MLKLTDTLVRASAAAQGAYSLFHIWNKEVGNAKLNGCSNEPSGTQSSLSFSYFRFVVIYFFLLYVYGCFAGIHIYVPHTCNAYRGHHIIWNGNHTWLYATMVWGKGWELGD